MTIPTATNGRRIWLNVGTLLDGLSTRPLRNAHVVYDKHQIFFNVGETSASRVTQSRHARPGFGSAGLHTAAGTNRGTRTFFPRRRGIGFGERAAHLKRKSVELLSLARPRLERIVRLGVVAVRDAGDKDGVGLALSQLNASANRPPLMPYVDSPELRFITIDATEASWPNRLRVSNRRGSVSKPASRPAPTASN